MGGIEPWAPGSYLAELPAQVSKELLALGVRRQFAAGHPLIYEGDRETHVELLVSGFVKVTTVSEGLETLLAVRVPGDIVGETAALTGKPRSATVTACGRVTSIVISRADFRRFLRRHPDAALNMAATLGERLRWANRRRSEFAAYPAALRLARILLEFAVACGRATDDGVTIGVRLSQPELATMVGIADATVQKAIRELRQHGLIRTGYRQITIVDLDALSSVRDNPDGWPPPEVEAQLGGVTPGIRGP
jgi:CRP-like cAMP-binding protein